MTDDPTASAATVYCNRCAAVLITDHPLRAAQDHEMDEHPDGWGVTVYERIDT